MRWRLVDTSRYEVVEKGFNSPIPDPRDLDPSLWEKPRELRGIPIPLDEQLSELEDLTQRSGERRWRPNPMYGPLDAAVLRGIIDKHRPNRFVELGSGATTHIIREALGREHEAYDPYTTIDGVHRVKAQDVPLEVFTTLAENDVLFVDTTHIVRTGGDVTRIVLDVLPRLAPGVLVHFHDVVLPWEVDRRWLANGWYWTEQYLLEAFLSGNPEWRVELAVHALSRTEDVSRLVPAHRPEHLASAFWIRRARSTR